MEGDPTNLLDMNKLSSERRAQILGMMVEGNSIRAIVRMTGVSKNTVAKLLEDAGEAFSRSATRLTFVPIDHIFFLHSDNHITAKVRA